jgi:hypothetical protein
MKAMIIQILRRPVGCLIDILPLGISYRPWQESIFVSKPLDTEGLTMALPKRYAKQQAKAKDRQRQNAKARHQRQQQDAQRYIHTLHQALTELGLPDHLVLEIEGRLKAQKKLLGKIFGLMFPTLFGATSTYELTRVRGWDKNMPTPLLEALPKRSWLKRLRKLAQDILVPLWRYTQSMSAATQRRWPWS